MHEHYFLTTQNRFGSQSWSNFGVMWKPETSILDLSEVDDILCPKIKLSINKYLHCHIFWIFQWGRNSWCHFNNISKVICGKKNPFQTQIIIKSSVFLYTLLHVWGKSSLFQGSRIPQKIDAQTNQGEHRTEQKGGNECLSNTRGNFLCFQTGLFTQRHRPCSTASNNAPGLITRWLWPSKCSSFSLSWTVIS